MSAAAQPVWLRLQVTAPPAAREALSVLLTDCGAGGVVEEETTLTAYYTPEQQPAAETALRQFCSRSQPPPQWCWQREEGEPWRDAWKAHFHAFRASEHIAVCPSWEPHPDYGEQVRVLELDPGRAFGTGAHETTRLCLQLLDHNLCARRVPRVLDVGCGSGILSLAAAALGTEQVVAVDVDRDAAAATRENATRNGLESGIAVLCGDLRCVRGHFPLVVANILYQILLGLAPTLATRTAPGGRLILSGLLREELPSAARVYGDHGLRPVGQEVAGDWGALVLARQD